MIYWLYEAIDLAFAAHCGQTDKQGEPYVFHLMRVANSVRTDEVARVVAVLHDLIEDTPYTVDNLRDRGFPAEVVDAVDAISRREDEPYPEYVRRCALNPIARMVKLADIEDNLYRTKALPEIDRARLTRRYVSALIILRQEEENHEGPSKAEVYPGIPRRPAEGDPRRQA